jgi:hypothetical protein
LPLRSRRRPRPAAPNLKQQESPAPSHRGSVEQGAVDRWAEPTVPAPDRVHLLFVADTADPPGDQYSAQFRRLRAREGCLRKRYGGPERETIALDRTTMKRMPPVRSSTAAGIRTAPVSGARSLRPASDGRASNHGPILQVVRSARPRDRAALRRPAVRRPVVEPGVRPAGWPGPGAGSAAGRTRLGPGRA